jgi:hypothetical protein
LSKFQWYEHFIKIKGGIKMYFRSKGNETINYSVEEVKDKTELDEDFRVLEFRYDESGTMVSLGLEGCKGLTNEQIINLGIKKLVNFNNVIIKECIR